MAKKFLTSIRLANLSSDPNSASNGDIYYNSSTHKTKIYQNNSWQTLPSSLSDLSDVSASSISNNQVLAYNSTVSKWEPQSVPAPAIGTGPSFPSNPSLGTLFFNTTTKRLYFYYQDWAEIAFVILQIDGGIASTTQFADMIDGGNATTTIFSDGVHDGGKATTIF